MSKMVDRGVYRDEIGAVTQEKDEKKEISRRRFLTNVAASGAALAIVPRRVLGRGFTPPSDTLNVAGIGVGGMGRNNLINLASQNIVALCDVDWGYAGKALDHPEPAHAHRSAGAAAAPGPTARGV